MDTDEEIEAVRQMEEREKKASTAAEREKKATTAAVAATARFATKAAVVSKDDSDAYDAETDEDEAPAKGRNGNSKEAEEDSDAAYNADTDVDDDDDGGFPPLPSFFSGRVIVVVGDFSAREMKLLRRRIVAAAGDVSEYMRPDADVVVTNSNWGSEFDEAAEENPRIRRDYFNFSLFGKSLCCQNKSNNVFEISTLLGS
jgi:hypothetical protein